MELVEGPAHPFLAREEDARSLQIGSWALGLLLGTGQNTGLFTLGTGQNTGLLPWALDSRRLVLLKLLRELKTEPNIEMCLFCLIKTTTVFPFEF